MDEALVSELLMVAVPLVRKEPPAIDVKTVGPRPLSFELKALALLMRAWHDQTHRGTVAELRDRWSEFRILELRPMGRRSSRERLSGAAWLQSPDIFI